MGNEIRVSGCIQVERTDGVLKDACASGAKNVDLMFCDGNCNYRYALTEESCDAISVSDMRFVGHAFEEDLGKVVMGVSGVFHSDSKCPILVRVLRQSSRGLLFYSVFDSNLCGVHEFWEREYGT